MQVRYIPLIITGFIAGSGSAQECDPAVILRQDTKSTILSDETALIYVKQSASSKSAAAASGGTLGFTLYNVPVQVGYQTTSAVASHIESKLGIKYSNKEYSYYLHKYMSDNAVAAYEACLGKQKIIVAAPKEASQNSEFFATVQARFGPLAGTRHQLTLRAINGKLGDDAYPSGSMKFPVKSESRIPVRVSSRDTSKPTFISAQVGQDDGGTEAGEIAIPPYKPFQVTVNILTSEPLKRTAPKYVRHESNTCVKASSGVLIPETAAWVSIRRTPGTSFTIDPRSTPQQVCGTLPARGSDFGNASITGQLSVHAIVVAPVSEVP